MSSCTYKVIVKLKLDSLILTCTWYWIEAVSCSNEVIVSTDVDEEVDPDDHGNEERGQGVRVKAGKCH